MKKKLETHKIFIGLHFLKWTNAELKTLEGQCCYGATAMMGTKNGVAKRFKDLNPKTVVVYCFGHVSLYVRFH